MSFEISAELVKLGLTPFFVQQLHAYAAEHPESQQLQGISAHRFSNHRFGPIPRLRDFRYRWRRINQVTSHSGLHS